MKIADIRVNGIREPLGFSLPQLSVSWKTVETESKAPVSVRLRVAADPGFSQILFEREGAKLRAIGEEVPLALRPRTRYYVQVEVRGDAGDAAVGESWFETGKLEEPWQAKWIGPAAGDDFHPVFFRGFPVPEGVASARLYVTGLGLYEAYLNCEKAGDDLLAPFCNDYDERVQA